MDTGTTVRRVVGQTDARPRLSAACLLTLLGVALGPVAAQAQPVYVAPAPVVVAPQPLYVAPRVIVRSGPAWGHHQYFVRTRHDERHWH